MDSGTRVGKANINNAVDNIGLFLIGAFSFFYYLFSSSFAELHIKFNFLDFPIFIGEFLILAGLVLLSIKWKLKIPLVNRWYWLWFIYFAFILGKAFWGYHIYGPLAFRHAALFYYPIFAIFGYFFYNRSIFTKSKILFLIVVSFIAIKFSYLYAYSILTSFIFSLILIRAYHNRPICFILFFILLLITPYRLFFATARTMLLSYLITALFIIVSLFLVRRLKKGYRVIIAFVLVGFIMLGIMFKADPNDLRSLYRISDFLVRYRMQNEFILSRVAEYKAKEINEVGLYNPDTTSYFAGLNNKLSPEKMQAKNSSLEPIYSGREKNLPWITLENKLTGKNKKESDKPQSQKGDKNSINKSVFDYKKEPGKLEPKEIVRDSSSFKEKRLSSSTKNAPVIYTPPAKIRDIEDSYAASLFRIFIWKDILEALIIKKPILGFDFGRPFRSRNIEILHWASGDWEREGWVAIHNGYIDILCRAGIAGVFIILTIFLALLTLIKKSIRLCSIDGVLLCGIIISWLVAANFLEILELPYTAIPFWSIFGLAFAYLNTGASSR